ncbi:MAG: hypothetical protein KME19_14685 [Microcoleus vaginatus WJT46-NPBG5]|jgi:hypothetical protein|nr:hypothetical protein [Microcoleus vaginatus WJT46-NPBG5]
MISQDLIFLFRETACRFVLRQPLISKEPSECLLNLPCGCSNPGTAIKCEDCPYLEGCLSRVKSFATQNRHTRV